MSAGSTSIRRPAAHDRVYVVAGVYHQTFGTIGTHRRNGAHRLVWVNTGVRFRCGATREWGPSWHAERITVERAHEIATPCVGCYGVES